MLNEAETILEEGIAHYKTRRFVDAAKSFKHLTRIAISNTEFEDAIYFFYRELLAWNMSKELDQIVKTWADLAEFALKNTARVAMQAADEEKHPLKRATILKTAIKSLISLGEHAEAQRVREVLLNDLLQIARQFDLDPIDKISKYQNALRIALEIKDKPKALLIYSEMGDVHSQIADQKLNDPNFSSEEVALKELQKALECYSKAESQKKIKEIKKKIEAIQSS